MIPLEARGGAEVSTPQYTQPRALVIRMLTALGLPVEWCPRARACRNWDERIVVTLAAAAPRRLSEYALAEAHAFEGRTIRLHRDRMPAASAGWIAHVLAHEITHLLRACRSAGIWGKGHCWPCGKH